MKVLYVGYWLSGKNDLANYFGSSFLLEKKKKKEENVNGEVYKLLYSTNFSI